MLAVAPCMDILSLRVIVGLKSGMPRESSNKFWKDWSTVTPDALLIETSNLRIYFWTTTTISKSSISASLLVSQMKRRSKFSVVLHRIWRLRLSVRQSIVVHLPTSGHSVYSYLLFCLANFLIGVPLTKSYMTRFAGPIISFLNRSKKLWAQKRKTSLPNCSP